MIIKRFSARKVHEYYDFNFSFNEDVSFLVGINGSGKTTALKLMQACIMFDIQFLVTNNFHSAEIEIIDLEREMKIRIEKTNDFTTFTVNEKTIKIEIPPYLSDEKIKNNKIESEFERIRYDVITKLNENIEEITNQRCPLFLGLDRSSSRYGEDYYDELNYLHKRIGNHRVSEKIEGIENCHRLVESAYRKYRRASDGNLDRILNIILESTFEYIDFSDKTPIIGIANPIEEIKNFQRRRPEIEDFAKKIAGPNKLTLHIDKFFSKLEKITHENTEKDELTLQWIVNATQIRRVKSIIEELDRQKKAAERFYSPIKEYIDSMNKFFKHSKKSVEIDAVGKIKISQNGKKVDIDNLSSGEKQLFILLTHAKLGSGKKRTFIVDEPELSLHMKWQEMLVDELLDFGEKNQFIFATHSPEIVGLNTKKCINVG